MFERFTNQSIKTIMLAQEESRRLGHNFVSSEQILVGLLAEGTGIAAKALNASSVSLKDARVEVEKMIGRGSGFVKLEIPFVDDAKRALEMSWVEAKRLEQTEIDTEHLLLGILKNEDCVAVKVLQELGVSISELEKKVNQLVR